MFQIEPGTEKLFAKPVRVTIKDVYTNQSRSCRLFLTMEWKEVTSSIHKRELLISLTDNADPFFLHQLQLSDEDFQILKTSHCLLVDFFAFPEFLIDYLERCLAEEKNAQPRFQLVFNSNESILSGSSLSQLDVVEFLQYRHLAHLSLKFIGATESSIKQYMAVCLKNLKEDKQQLQSQLNYLEQDFKDKLTKCQTALDQKAQELDSMRKELSTELCMRESRHSKELQEERDKLLTRQREEVMKIDRELKDKEYKFRQEIEQLENRISTKDALNKELQDKISKQDRTVRELKSRLSDLEDETKRNGESLRSYKEKIQNLNFDLGEKNANLVSQKNTLEELERTIVNKDKQIYKLNQELDELEKQKADLKKELSELKADCRKNRKTSDQFKEDVSKANRVIEKLQSEIQSVHEKLKHSKIAVAKQEQTILEKDKIIHIVQKELNSIKPDLDKRNNKVKSLTESVESLQERINFLENEVKTKDNVVKYLNRQLIEQCVIPPLDLQTKFVDPPSRPQALTLNAAGEPGLQDTRSSPSAPGVEKSKVPLSTRHRSQGLFIASKNALHKRHRC